MNVLVQDNPARRRFEILVDGGLAGFAAYQVRENAVIFTHTEVDPSYQGQGIGALLAGGALDEVRNRGDRAVAKCPYIVSFIERHPEYATVLAD